MPTADQPIVPPIARPAAFAPAHIGGLLHARAFRVAFVLAVLCVAALLLLINHSFTELQRVNAQRQDVQVVRGTLDGLTDTMAAAQSSERGYLLVGEDQDAQAFASAHERIGDLLKQLDTKVVGIPLDSGRLYRFQQLVRQQLEDMSHAVELRKEGKSEVATFSSTSAVTEEQAQALKRLGSQLKSGADALIAIQNVDFAQRVLYSRIAFMASVVAIFLAFLLYAWQRYRLRQADLQRQEMLRTERDRLEAEVAKRTRELAELAAHLQRVVEGERAQLAQALHDELGALMIAAKLDLARLQSRLPEPLGALAEPLTQLKDVLNDVMALKRRITDQLYPTTLRDLGLIAALEILARTFRTHTGLTVATDLEAVALDANAELTVYRLVQESLTNVAKHAHAQRVNVTLVQEDGTVRVQIEDDGTGFDPAQRHHGTHGIAGIRHRLWACGGQLEIKSTPGAGACITANIPAFVPALALAPSKEGAQ